MEVRETIRIEGTPFPSPLPVQVNLIQRTFAQHGFVFEDMGNNRSVVLNDLFAPERLSYVEQIIEAESWLVKVTRSIWPVFDDIDYERAPFWILNFTDIWIDEIDPSSVCDQCGQELINVNTRIKVPVVSSNRPLLSVNGQFKIVSAEVKTAISESLSGVCVYPFDDQERYFYLWTKCDLGPLIIKKEEVISYTGECSRCMSPQFKTFFGPLRFAKSRWSGEDIVREAFHHGLLFTPKAFNLLRTFDRSLAPDGIAVLE